MSVRPFECSRLSVDMVSVSRFVDYVWCLLVDFYACVSVRNVILYVCLSADLSDPD